MNQRCLTLTTQINEMRINKNKQLLWPDYEIFRHLVRFKNNHDEMYEYCNMDKLTILNLKSQDCLKDNQQIMGKYSHIWIQIWNQGNGQQRFKVYLSVRWIAIDSIYKHKQRWIIQIYQLDRNTYIAGLQLKSKYTTSKLITSKSITKQKYKFIIQFQVDDGFQYGQLNVIGSSNQPIYGNYRRSNLESLKNGVLVYQCLTGVYGSWISLQCEEDIDRFGGGGGGGIFSMSRLCRQLKKYKQDKQETKTINHHSEHDKKKLKVIQQQKKYQQTQQKYTTKQKNNNKIINNINISQIKIKSYTYTQKIAQICQNIIHECQKDLQKIYSQIKEIHKLNQLQQYNSQSIQIKINEGDYEDQTQKLQQTDNIKQTFQTKDTKISPKTPQTIRLYLGAKSTETPYIQLYSIIIDNWIGNKCHFNYDFDEEYGWMVIDKSYNEGIYQVEVDIGHLQVIKDIFENGELPSSDDLPLTCYDCIVIHLILLRYLKESRFSTIFLFQAIKKITNEMWLDLILILSLPYKQNNKQYKYVQIIQKLYIFLQKYVIGHGLQIIRTRQFKQIINKYKSQILNKYIKNYKQLPCLLQYCYEYAVDKIDQLQLFNVITKVKLISISFVEQQQLIKQNGQFTVINKKLNVFCDQFLFGNLYWYQLNNKNYNVILSDRNILQNKSVLEQEKLLYNKISKPNQKNPDTTKVGSALSTDGQFHKKIEYQFDIDKNTQMIFTPIFTENYIKFRLIYIKQQNVQNQQRYNLFNIYIQFLGVDRNVRKQNINKQICKQIQYNQQKITRFICGEFYLEDNKLLKITTQINDKLLIKITHKQISKLLQQNTLFYKFNIIKQQFLDFISQLFQTKLTYHHKDPSSSLPNLKKTNRGTSNINTTILQMIQDQNNFCNLHQIMKIQQLHLYQLCFSHQLGEECQRCFGQSQLYNIDQNYLKLIIDSNLIEIRDQAAILLFVVNYYQIKLKKAIIKTCKLDHIDKHEQNKILKQKMREPKTLEQITKDSHITGQLFNSIRYSYIPISYIFNIAESREWIRYHKHYRQILYKVFEQYYFGMKKLQNQPRVCTRDILVGDKWNVQVQQMKIYKEIQEQCKNKWKKQWKKDNCFIHGNK